MPIVRSYMCETCAHQMTVTLTAEQWDEPAPDCPRCAERNMRQEFRPFAIGGSTAGKAHALTEDIAANDYHVADMSTANREGDVPTVRYKDQVASAMPTSTWGMGANSALMQTAMAAGRQTRLSFGSGLDILQANIKSGVEPDLIENAKRRAIRIS
jgi:hypothetical protein